MIKEREKKKRKGQSERLVHNGVPLSKFMFGHELLLLFSESSIASALRLSWVVCVACLTEEVNIKSSRRFTFSNQFTFEKSVYTNPCTCKTYAASSTSLS